MTAPASKPKRIDELPQVDVVKDDSLFLFIQDGETVISEVRNYFNRIGKVKKHDFYNNASYCGVAEGGTDDSSSLWKITKIIINNDGTTTTAIAQNVDWTNRYNHTYSIL
jgi:hypothetical protein